jgi:hypothetical protein
MEPLILIAGREVGSNEQFPRNTKLKLFCPPIYLHEMIERKSTTATLSDTYPYTLGEIPTPTSMKNFAHKDFVRATAPS